MPEILFITVCEGHHACAEVSSKPNKKDGDQTCKKSRCFYTRKPCLSYSFQNDDTQGFQNSNVFFFSGNVKSIIYGTRRRCYTQILEYTI